MAKLTPERRSEIARRAAVARWARQKKREMDAVREQLAFYFGGKAAFREELVKKFPWHAAKNDGYARSLRLVIAHIEGLLDDDPTLLALSACGPLWHEEGLSAAAPSADNAAVHCGPRGWPMEPEGCAEWFAPWAAEAIEEAKELADRL